MMTRKLKWLLFPLAILALPTTLFAQARISGHVQNLKGEPLPFANVLLLVTEDFSVFTDVWYNESRLNNNKGAHVQVSHQLHPKHQMRIDYDHINLRFDSPSSYRNTHRIYPVQGTYEFEMEIESTTPMRLNIFMGLYFQASYHFNVKCRNQKQLDAL